MRLEGWESRLAAVIEAARREPYALGRHDCFRVACLSEEALTGVNRWPQFEGRYATKREALALIAQYGHSFDQAFSWFFGSQPVPAKLARRGDIVKFVDETGEAHLGVCTGRDAAVLGERGLLFVPVSGCGACWRIG